MLNGAKQFCSNAKRAKLAIVFAVTDPDLGKKGLSAFLVPTDTPGYEVVRVEDKLGQHSSDTCQLAFNDMRISADLRLGAEGEANGAELVELVIVGDGVGAGVFETEGVGLGVTDGVGVGVGSGLFEEFGLGVFVLLLLPFVVGLGDGET